MSSLHKIQKIFFLLLSALLFSSYASAGLLDELTDNQHILLVRHANAPGYGDPAGYRLDQCSTQRNLGDEGKVQARALGQWLSQQGVEQAKVFSSPWCRCIDTATLLQKGTVQIDQSLGSFFDNSSTSNTQTKGLEALISRSLSGFPKTPIIMVTHQVNIQAFTGQSVNVGDVVLVKVNQQGQYLSHRIYTNPKM